jgi:16S rRNA (uracil1498-N3)-methyltransferase
MPAERYFHPGELINSSIIDLENTELHHLVHVMRAKEGDALEIVNGQGVLAQAILERLEKKKAKARIEKVDVEPKSKFEIILAQGIPRINRLDFILEKGTELGMTQLWLFPGDYSERKSLSEHQLERMSSVTIAAMKQCGRLYLPQIHLKPCLEKWGAQEFTVLFGDVSPNAPKLTDVFRGID